MSLNSQVIVAFKSSFENRCFELVVSSYKEALSHNSVSVDWNENDITSQLHNYIDKSAIRIKWSITSNVEHHIFDESSSKEKGFAAKLPRIDLRFTTFKSKNEFIFFFEAKNLKETDSALKRRYIDTGIDSYISKKYSNGCLLGYHLEGDLDLTIEGINSLLVKDKRDAEKLVKQKSKCHDSFYISSHSTIGDLRHLMMDFVKRT